MILQRKQFNTIYDGFNGYIIALITAGIILTSMILFTGTLHADEYAGKKASLWRPNSSFAKIYTDPRASTINDIITIQINESTTASNKAELSTSKKTSLSMGIDNFLGLEKQMK
jgi:flagellar basal body L-ring protein FlgH